MDKITEEDSIHSFRISNMLENTFMDIKKEKEQSITMITQLHIVADGKRECQMEKAISLEKMDKKFNPIGKMELIPE